MINRQGNHCLLYVKMDIMVLLLDRFKKCFKIENLII